MCVPRTSFILTRHTRIEIKRDPVQHLISNPDLDFDVDPREAIIAGR